MRIRTMAASVVAAAVLATLSFAVPASAAPASGAKVNGTTRVQAGGYGYVSQGNLRPNPNLNNTPIVTIYNQWVNLLCWIDGGDNGFGSNRWFKAQYYGNTGYISSGVVTSQPVVGHC